MIAPLRRPWLAIAPVGLAAGAGALALVLTSDHEENVVALSVLGLLLGWSFIGTGLYGWARRPDNATGRLMVAVGFAWFLSALAEANSSLPYTIGSARGLPARAPLSSSRKRPRRPRSRRRRRACAARSTIRPSGSSSGTRNATGTSTQAGEPP